MADTDTDLRRFAVAGGLMTAAVVWSFWPPLAGAADRWSSDPQYSHGYLVPLFAGYLLWSRREQLAGAALRPAWAGLGLFAAAAGVRWFGTVYYFNGLDLLALLPALAGAVLVAGGWAALRWSLPGVLFLAFMIPLPYRLQTAMSGELQRVATRVSTYALQTLGVPAVAEGNVIQSDVIRVGVVDACSGLGMVVTFAAMSAAVAIVIRSAWWAKAVVLALAAPLAVVSNVARITLTGWLYQQGYGETGKAVYHDLAGWLMMPLASALLLAEVYILDRVTVAADPADVGPATLSLTGDR